MKRRSFVVSIILCLALLLGLGATSVFATEAQETGLVESWGMTLNDEIVVNFKMNFTAEILEDDGAYVEVTVGSRSYNVPVNQIGEALAVPVFATQMTETITLCIVDGNGARSEENSFTAKEYCQTLLNNPAYACYHPLVKELLNYGSAAQQYFTYRTEDLAGEGILDAGQQEVPAGELTLSRNDQSEQLECYGASMVYRDKIALRFYFNGSLTDCGFAATGASGEPVVNAEGGYVEVVDITPQNFDKAVTLTATDALGGTLSITYCPMDYIIYMSQKGSDNSKALVKALYNYHLAAKDFVPVESFDVSFDLNYAGATGTPEAIEIAIGDGYGELPAPTRYGYTFSGWYTDAACSGSAVTADTLVTASGTLYAKWTVVADTSALVPKYNVETVYTGVSREFFDEKDTVVFTTEGKTLINTGWQRRLEFVSNDADKEIVKFRFKYVSNNNANGEAVAPKINFFVGGLEDTNYGHFVITDGSGNVVNNLEVGTWYTFYGMTQGNTRLALYPCNTTEQLRTTLYIQDRELLDYEPAIYVNQPTHAYFGSTAFYEDAEGNWTTHFRSFTGQHHSNTADNRKTDLIVNGEYTAVAFDFKFNVSQYAASGEELADYIYMESLNAVYYDMEGNLVTLADMEVGTWYKAYVTNSGDAVVTDRFYIMGYKDGSNGNTVNIDMDMRNFVGFAPDTNDVVVGSAYGGTVYRDTVEGENVYRFTTRGTAGTAGQWKRGVYIGGPAEKMVVSLDFRFTEALGSDGTEFAPALGVLRAGQGNGGTLIEHIRIYDTDGNEVVRNNAETGLTVGQWYTLVVSTKATATIELYAAHNCKTDIPTVTMEIRDRFSYIPGDITMTTPQALEDPVMRYTEEDGWHYYIVDSGATLTAEQRQAYVQIPEEGAIKFAYEVKFNSVSGNATPRVGIITGNIRYYELDGTLVGTQNDVSLELGKWYKVEMSKNEGANLGTNWLFGFIGDAANNAGNVCASFRNLEITYPMADVVFDLNHTAATKPLQTVEIIEGHTYGELPAPTRGGFTFEGWYTDAACSGEPVTAETVVSASHSLYAKWTLSEDTNPLQPSYNTEIAFTVVSRDVIDTQETIIYTTNGMPAPTEGDYQKRMQFTVTDTAKEVVKFRFKFVTYNDAEGNPVTPKIDFYAGGLTAGYRGHYTVTDDSGNVVTELATGTWYTFYGLHRGNAVVSFWPTYQYGMNNVDVTLYVQDRELLDFEQEIYLTQGDGHAYTGRLAPYQDAQGNWTYHFYSYTGTQVNNSAWQRRTILNVPTGYSHVAFEFKFNVADYGAVGEELENKVTYGFGGTTLAYYELDGTPVAAANLVTGKWYRAIVASPAASNTLYAMGASTNVYDSTNKVYTHTANLDMEYRNFVGHVSDGYTVSTPDTFADPSFVYTSGDGWYQYIPDNGAAITAWARRTNVTIPTDGATKLSYEAKLNSISGDATSAIYVVGARGQEIYDLETGELLGTNNDVILEQGKWYRFVTYKADNSNLGTSYEFCYPGDGSHNAGNCSVSFRNFEAIYPES